MPATRVPAATGRRLLGAGLGTVGETVALALAVWALNLPWVLSPGEARAPVLSRQALRAGLDAFGLPLSTVWSPHITPDQPRVGVVLLVVALGGAVWAWAPALRRVRALRMMTFLLAAGTAAAIIGRHWRLHRLSEVGPGIYLTGGGFYGAALAASGLLRAPVLVLATPAVLGAGLVVGVALGGAGG